MINYIIGLGSVLIVIGVFYNFIKNSKNNKKGCSCGCNGCSSVNQCNHNK